MVYNRAIYCTQDSPSAWLLKVVTDYPSCILIGGRGERFPTEQVQICSWFPTMHFRDGRRGCTEGGSLHIESCEHYLPVYFGAGGKHWVLFTVSCQLKSCPFFITLHTYPLCRGAWFLQFCFLLEQPLWLVDLVEWPPSAQKKSFQMISTPHKKGLLSSQTFFWKKSLSSFSIRNKEQYVPLQCEVSRIYHSGGQSDAAATPSSCQVVS